MASKEPVPKKEKEINFVHQAEIRTESIKKERRYEGKNFKYDYTFHPNNLYPYAEKPQLVSPDRPFTSNDTVARMKLLHRSVHYQCMSLQIYPEEGYRARLIIDRKQKPVIIGYRYILREIT